MGNRHRKVGVEYEVFHIKRVCEFSGGCDNVVTHYAAPKGQPWVRVWCMKHAYEARVVGRGGVWV